MKHNGFRVATFVIISLLLVGLLVVHALKPSPLASLDSRPFEYPGGASFDDADVRVLFIGNSHTSACGMADMFRHLCESDGRDRRFHVESCTGGAFLADHAESERTLTKIGRDGWDFVVLQAQKYSTSGRYSYPVTGAVHLAKVAQEHNARVLMFPEWRRRGHVAEGVRIHKLHESIAEQSGANVAPVGLAWDLALEQDPNLELHASDGNHAAPKGAYLTACVFYSVVVGKSPEGLSAPEQCTLTPQQTSMLQSSAWESVRSNAAPIEKSPSRE